MTPPAPSAPTISQRPNRLGREAICGTAIGGILGALYGFMEHLQVWLHRHPDWSFTGAPQGSDQLVYMALNQAIWRTGNGLTYSYPFTVPPDATAPILLQLPFALTSALGWILGLPMAYEVLRVLGAAAAGALLVLLTHSLTPSSRGRRSFYAAAVFGGGFLWIKGVHLALDESGLDGLSILPDWYQMAAGQFYWWLPNLLSNLRLPLEPLNHATVFGVLVGIAWRRPRLSLAFGILAWLTNPFPGIVASMVGLGVAGIASIQTARRKGLGRAIRGGPGRELIGWSLLTGMALLYYGPVQALWPDLAEVSRMHRLELSPPPSVLDMLAMMGPWIVGFAAVPVALRSDPRGLRRPLAAAMAVMALGQTLLQVQGWIIGNRAFQPYHFNRGYLGLSLAALTLLMMPVWIRALRRWNPWTGGRLVPRTRAGAVIVLTLWTCLDPILFVARDVLSKPPGDAIIHRDLARTLSTLSKIPGAPRLVHAPVLSNTLAIAALTPHVPYQSSHWIAFPYSDQRGNRMREALGQAEDPTAIGDPIRDLGISVLLLTTAPVEPWTGYARTHEWIPLPQGLYTLWLAPGVPMAEASPKRP